MDYIEEYVFYHVLDAKRRNGNVRGDSRTEVNAI